MQVVLNVIHLMINLKYYFAKLVILLLQNCKILNGFLSNLILFIYSHILLHPV